MTKAQRREERIENLISRLPSRLSDKERERYERWIRDSALFRSLVAASVWSDDFQTAAKSQIVGPKIGERLRTYNAPEGGNLATTLGTLAGTAGQVALASAVLSALAPVVAGAAAAGRIPGLARAVAGVRRASPLAQEVLRDMAIGPLVEGMRLATGHDVSAGDFARSMVITGGAGLGAIGGRTLGQGLSRAGTRAAMTAGATAGGLVGSLPFSGHDTSMSEALITGLSMGLLYPAGGRAQLPARPGSVEAPAPGPQAIPTPQTPVIETVSVPPDAPRFATVSARRPQVDPSTVPARPATREELLRFAEELGDAQRAAPEDAMLRAQFTVGGGVINPVIEHTGDLTHRLTDGLRNGPKGYGGYEVVKEKVERVLFEYLDRHPGHPNPPFEEHWARQIKNNAKALELPEKEYAERVNKALKKYADEHRKLPVFNDIQRLSRDAAVAVGEQRWDDARRLLRRINDEYLQDREVYEKAVRQFGFGAPQTTGGIPTEALEFINTRRSPQRKAYAQKYAEWLAGGEQGPMPEAEGITTRGVNEIRERIDAAFNRADGPTQLPMPVELDDISIPAPRQQGGVRTVRSIPPPDMPIRVYPEGAEVIAQQGGTAATVDFVTGQGGVPLYRPVHEVVGEVQSLPRNEYYKLPRALRGQLGEIDEHVKDLNAQAQRLLRRNRVTDPSELPAQAQAQYAEVMEQLREMDGRRNSLRPAVMAELEKRGALGRVISDRIEDEIAAAVVPIEGPAPKVPSHIEFMEARRPWEAEVRTSDVAPQLDPEELRLRNHNVFHDQEDAIIGFVSEIQPESSIEAMRVFRTADYRHLDIEQAPVDLLDAIRGRKPNWLNALFTTMRDMFGEDVAKQVRDAKHMDHVFVRQWSKVLDDILRPFRGSRGAESRVRIAKVLDGTPVEGVTQAEREAAQQLRERFFNPLFEEFGIDPDRFLTDYLPRLRAGNDLSREIPAEEWIKIKFFAEEVRTAIDAQEPREWDVLELTTRYLRSGSKRKFMEPARQAVEPAVANMDPHRRMMFETWFGQLTGRRTMDEIMLDDFLDRTVGRVVRAFGGTFSDRPSQELSLAATHLIHLGTIGFNAFSIVKNLTQQIHTMAHVGTGYWAKAHRALRTQSGKELLKYNWVGQHRVYLEGMELQRTLFDRITGPVSDLAFRGYQWADQMNVNTAYMAAVLKDLDEGRTLAHAINSGNYTAMLTQFGYGVDNPALFRTPVGRLLGALRSYPVNFARMLYAQGTTGHKAEAIKTVVGLVAGAWALEKVTKMDFSSITPWETLKGHPGWAALRGDFSIPVDTLTGGSDFVEKFITERDPDVVDSAFDNLKEQMKLFIPGRTQYKRIARFIDRVRNDWKEVDSQGRPLYSVTPGEAIRGILGPTAEAKVRWNIRREYEQTLMEDVDPLRFRNAARALNAAETLVVGDAAYRRKIMREKADRVGLDGRELHQQSLARVRQYYYGDGKNGFWPAVYRNDTSEAQRTAEVLKRLEVTTPQLIASGESRGLDPSLIQRGVRIFGYIGMPQWNVPKPDLGVRSSGVPSLTSGSRPLPSVQRSGVPLPSL